MASLHQINESAYRSVGGEKRLRRKRGIGLMSMEGDEERQNAMAQNIIGELDTRNKHIRFSTQVHVLFVGFLYRHLGGDKPSKQLATVGCSARDT